jgi:prephenate dehydrogenase
VKVAIIGGSGKMGRWFASFLRKDGKEVVITGRNQKKLVEIGRQLGVAVAPTAEALKDADAILLSVSIDSFEEVVAQISPHVRPGQIVVDITSVKVLPVDIMHRYLNTDQILGAHPLFGPGAAILSNQNVVLTPTNDGEQILAMRVKEYLEDRGARVSLMTPQEHDEKMSIVMGLSHFVAIVSADVLVNSGKLKPDKSISGVTYRVLLTLLESVLSEDPALYASLQMNLPGTAEVESLFLEKAGAWAELVRSKDRQRFIQQMEALRSQLERDDADFGKAYENMYKLTAEL